MVAQKLDGLHSAGQADGLQAQELFTWACYS